MKIRLIGFPGKGGGGDAEGSMSPQSEAFAGKAGNSPGVCPHGTALTSLLRNGISTITRPGEAVLSAPHLLGEVAERNAGGRKGRTEHKRVRREGGRRPFSPLCHRSKEASGAPSLPRGGPASGCKSQGSECGQRDLS